MTFSTTPSARQRDMHRSLDSWSPPLLATGRWFRCAFIISGCLCGVLLHGKLFDGRWLGPLHAAPIPRQDPAAQQNPAAQQPPPAQANARKSEEALASVGIRGRWPRDLPLTLSYHVSTQNLPDAVRSGIDARRFQATLEEAMAQWQGTGAVTFVRTTEVQDADFTISWQAETHGECARLLRWEGQRGHTGPLEKGTFIHLNRDIGWRPRPVVDGQELPPKILEQPANPLLSTLLHELGHVLGIGHSTEPDGVMNGAFHQHHTVLTDLDRGALHSLYGGGTDAPTDVAICTLDGDAQPRVRAMRLRRVALPGWQRQLIDLDRDGDVEMLSWPRQWTPGAGVLVYQFDDQGHLTGTIGPFSGLLSPALSLEFHETVGGSTSQDNRTVAFHRLQNGRYHASFFDEKLRLRPWPTGQALRLADGTADVDGDGVLDSQPVPRPQPLNIPDGWSWVAANGPDHLLSKKIDGTATSDEAHQYRLLRRDKEGAQALTPVFRGHDVCLARDANGALILAVQGLTHSLPTSRPEAPREQ